MQGHFVRKEIMNLVQTFSGKTLSVPDMMQIRPAAKATGLSEHLLRTLVRENRIVYIKVGNKVLVNIPKLIEYLNEGDAKRGESA